MPYSNNFYRQMYGYPLPYANLLPYEYVMPYRLASFCPYKQTYCPLLASMYFPPNRQMGEIVKKYGPSLLKFLIEVFISLVWDWYWKKEPMPIPVPRFLTQSDVDIISECSKNNPFRFAEIEQCLKDKGMDPAMASAVRANMEDIFNKKMKEMKDKGITPIPGVSGNWQTNLGMVHFTATPGITPNEVTIVGEYHWPPTGTISGTFKDGVMTGQWFDAPTAVGTVAYFSRYDGSMYRQRSGRFKIEFKFDSNGIPTFSGTMGEGDSETGISWSGFQILDEELSGIVLPPPPIA